MLCSKLAQTETRTKSLKRYLNHLLVRMLTFCLGRANLALVYSHNLMSVCL